MHEIRATVPPEYVNETTRLARKAGIDRVTVADVYVYGLDARRRVVSVETSTPKARAFVSALHDSPLLAGLDYSVTSRELRAIVSGADPAELTRPMSEPVPDIVQDLWQLSHLTLSYAGRAAAGGILLANGVIDDNPVAIVVAALFLPFMAEVLAVSFGVWSRNRRLFLHGLRALAVSTIVAFTAGALVAWLSGGPVRFAGFKSPLASFGLSAVIGITAGLSNEDDTGRRYLIGVAAAVQLAIFPVWLGAVSVAGIPPGAMLQEKLLSFGVNLVTISLGALAAFAVLRVTDGSGTFRRGGSACS